MQMSESPLVSIIIPCYNHEQFVQDCIQSVIDQSYENIELIIIDDGSKDSSVEKIQEMVPLCEQRFARFDFRHRSNKGLSATLNEALEWCKGEYVSPIASDDMMFYYKTEKQVEILLKDNQFVAVFGAIQLIDNFNNKVGEIRKKDKIFSFDDLIYTDHFLPAPTQMIRLKNIKEVGGFVDGMIIEDWYIYLKLLENDGKILYKNEFYSYYRIHDGNTFSTPFKMSLGRLQVLNEFKRHKFFQKAYIKACWDNALETLLLDFKMSLKILFLRVFFKIKQLFKKFLINKKYN